MQGVDKIWDYFGRREDAGETTFVCKGSRRSGKTWHILQNMMLRGCAIGRNYVGSVASMTNEQGRLGSYSDFKSICELLPYYGEGWDLKTSPLEARHRNGARMIFKSYADSETAKGIVCTDLFINEANKFTLQQYLDLKANVREYTYIDFNPNILFWVDDIFKPEDICHTTWQDNKHNLTKAQLEYFDTLYKLAHRPDASSVDKRNYMVYYLGQFAEITGQIFTPANIVLLPELPRRENGDLALRNFATFSDPSALRGADYFASCLSATDDDGRVWIIDTDSRNTGGRESVARWLLDICKAWDVQRVYVETNGVVGIDFYEFAQNSGLPVESWYSKGNKFQRIVDNFQNLTTNLVILDTPRNRDYLQQVYTFAEKCEHDDNADALNSSYNLQRWTA